MALSVGEALLIKELIVFLIKEGVSMSQIKKATENLINKVSSSSVDEVIKLIDIAQKEIDATSFPEEETQG